MEKLIEYLKQKYGTDINAIEPLNKTELQITVSKHTQTNGLSQSIQDHLVGHIDEFEILKINLVGENGNLIDSFSTTQ